MLVVLIDCLSNSSYMAQARKKKSVWVLHGKIHLIYKNRGITVIHYCFLTSSILSRENCNCTSAHFKKSQASYLVFWLFCACDGSLSTRECDVTCILLLLQLELASSTSCSCKSSLHDVEPRGAGPAGSSEVAQEFTLNDALVDTAGRLGQFIFLKWGQGTLTQFLKGVCMPCSAMP